jgi:DNA-binding CsgD family transcriptional regulator
MLSGREHELRTLDGLLAGAGEGRGGALVLVGQPGIGKTALLAAAAERAAAGHLRVLRTTGYEDESGLSYAGLHLLLRPAIERVAALPAPQRAALSAAFGLAAQDAAEPADQLLISLAVLTLLSELADADGAVLCVVDDAHWLDQPSLGALVFAARRLGTEKVALLFGTREGNAVLERSGLPALELAGLSGEAAQELLGRRAAALSRAAREQILAQAHGNPLALLELPPEAEPTGAGAEVLGGAPAPELPQRLIHAFRAQVEQLPRQTQSFLKLAAAAEGIELEVLLRAAPLFGVPAEAIGAAERAGILRVDGERFAFRHPLLRLALVSATPLPRRQAAHRALAGALTGPEDADRRIWYEAVAATEPDERLAAELERTAERMARRRGRPAAIGSYERAARLSPEPADRLRRWVLAAEASIDHGAAERAEQCARNAETVLAELAAAPSQNTEADAASQNITAGATSQNAELSASSQETEPGAASQNSGASVASQGSGGSARAPEVASTNAASALPDPRLRARLILARAAARFELGDLREAYQIAYTGAKRLAASGGPREAGWLLCQTVDIAWFLGDREVSAYSELFTTFTDIPQDDPAYAIGLYVESAILLSLRQELGFLPYHLREAVAKARGAGVADPGTLLTLGTLAPILAQDEEALELFVGILADCREHGRMAWYSPSLGALARIQAHLGRLAEARASAQQAYALAEAADQAPWLSQVSGLLAYLSAAAGAEEDCRAYARQALTDLAPTVMSLGESWGRWALGLLDLGLGRPAAALEHLRALENGAAVHQLAATRALPDLLEAAVRAGDRELAERTQDRLVRWAGGIRQDAADALVLRGEALLAQDDETAARGFTAALRLYEKSDRPFDRARTQLLWGERLRRERRRTEARAPLSAALETFEQLGAHPWAERARQELAASGGPASAAAAANAVAVAADGRGTTALAGLTSQEAQIVRLAAQGMSNRDIAAQLILSPRTVGHHLYKAYPKLGVLSRGELPAVLGQG